MTKKDIVKHVEKDPWMMDILKTVEKLNLSDWWIGSGFVRSKIWDYLHKYKQRTPIPDIDIIYLDKNDFEKNEVNKFSTKNEIKYQNILKKVNPKIKWSVTNQARMHIYHKRNPYKNSIEALSEWSETATCVGVKILKEKVTIAAPYGINDLVKLKLRKIPNYEIKYKHNPNLFFQRIKDKEWIKKWPKLKIVG